MHAGIRGFHTDVLKAIFTLWVHRRRNELQYSTIFLSKEWKEIRCTTLLHKRVQSAARTYGVLCGCCICMY